MEKTQWYAMTNRHRNVTLDGMSCQKNCVIYLYKVAKTIYYLGVQEKDVYTFLTLAISLLRCETNYRKVKGEHVLIIVRKIKICVYCPLFNIFLSYLICDCFVYFLSVLNNYIHNWRTHYYTLFLKLLTNTFFNFNRAKYHI